MKIAQRYANPELQNKLAGQYVLGTLHGRARQRFERLLPHDASLQTAVEYWQQRLNPLGQLSHAVKPPARVWRRIQQKIAPSSLPVWQQWNFWQGFVTASVLAVITLVLLPKPQTNVMQPTIAVLQTADERAMMVARMANDNTLMIEKVAYTQAPEHHIMQVWCIPKGGGEPMPIGVISGKMARFELDPHSLQMLHEAEAIAITFEPMDKPNMDKPTGEIMYKGIMI
ncbi:MAG: anti-sigma factor [Gammaproteobacteria bacterium]|nr:anti-sigma factor [Gammaproteobacteria bacterium]